MILPLFIFVILSCFLLYLAFRVRYDSSGRTLMLKMVASLQGMPSFVLKSSPKLCKIILDSSENKGRGIEMHLTCPAFLPLYNSESVDGDRWRRLLTMFRKIVHTLDYSERLPNIIKKHCKLICEEFDNIDSVAIQLLTARVFFELVFRKEIDIEDEKLCVDATMEWRRHVAQKGKSDPLLKEAMIERMLEHLKESNYDLEGFQKENHADKYEMASSFLQPFLISPIINFPDIFCEVSSLLEENPKYKVPLAKFCLDSDDILKDENEISLPLGIVYESLRLHHPFPILERELTKEIVEGKVHLKKGTHVYIELDSFIQPLQFKPENWKNKEYYKENSWILFATGPRMCAGRMIAIQVLEEMLKELVKNKKGDFNRLRMWENHKLSGRKNDNSSSLREVVYQIKTFSKLLKTLVFKRPDKKKFN